VPNSMAFWYTLNFSKAKATRCQFLPRGHELRSARYQL
jgi:hypothetical protein